MEDNLKKAELPGAYKKVKQYQQEKSGWFFGWCDCFPADALFMTTKGPV